MLHVLASVIAWVLALALTLGFLGAVFWVLRKVLRNSVTPASVRPRGFPGWVALFAGAIAASAVLSLIGWNAVRLAKGEVSLSDLACVGDPTDPCNWSSYRVQNNTGGAVVLRECRHHCAKGDRRLDPVAVRAGGTTSDDEVTALVGDRAWWQMRSSSNQLLGCLVLDGHRHKHDGDFVLVSSARPCRASAPSSATLAHTGQTLNRLG